MNPVVVNGHTHANGSSSFVDTAKNANGLTPRPARKPDSACVHRNVMGAAGGGNNAFASERGHPVFPVRVPSTTVSFSVGVLDPGAATSNHRHGYESLVYVLEGEGHTIMEGVRYDDTATAEIYTPPWCWHQHVAAEGSHVKYLTATNMPLLQSMGQTVLREEEETR